MSAVAFQVLAWYNILVHGDTLGAEFLCAAACGWTATGFFDARSKHTMRRNFPGMIHIRYLLEGIGPEIRQYLIQPDDEAAPFPRSWRQLIYRRAKMRGESVPFGSHHDMYKEGI